MSPSLFKYHRHENLALTVVFPQPEQTALTLVVIVTVLNHLQVLVKTVAISVDNSNATYRGKKKSAPRRKMRTLVDIMV